MLYNTFRLEIGRYWHNQIAATIINDRNGQIIDFSRPYSDYNLNLFNFIWQINYTMLFLTILSLVNQTKLQNAVLGIVNLVLNGLTLAVFLTGGLLSLSVLRDSFLDQTSAEYFPRTTFNLYFRYICFAFVIGLIFATYKYIKAEFMTRIIPPKMLEIAVDFVLFTSLLIILSSELINWMDIFKYNDSYKLGLSILWGVYAALLVGLGINKHKKHLRIGAIALFALTLMKLFFYDISDLNTISKTIVFVSLGVLLLIISFLYTKYRKLIFDENES